MKRWSLLTVLLVAAQVPAADKKLEYNRDIRPILAENCFACHGPDSAARKGGLRLDLREDALEKDAFVPGKPKESSLVERLYLPDNDKKRMPPPSSHKELKPEQKQILEQWIAQGAAYEPHWSFISPKQPTVPTVQTANRVRNPIDAFVLAELEKRGMTMAPEADKRTLARRLSLDLTGLPPDPADVNEFVKDNSPDAYEKLVDKFMRSQQWGEHRGRYWLDAARFADTHGIHFDNYREMWSYREWVINAFNANMKFDQFTIEQLAGDLLPNATLDQKIATGFNRCNITTNEGGAIAEEYLVLYARDRTETANQVFMGLTAGCAVCHDHKFDPISQKDFYSMAAFFNNTTQSAMDGNIKDTPPILFVPAVADRSAWAQIEKRFADVKAKSDARKKTAKADFEAWAKSAKASEVLAKLPKDGLKLHASFREGKDKKAKYTWFGTEAELVLPKDESDWRAGPQKEKVLGVKAKANGPTVQFPKEVGDLEFDQAFSYGAWVQIPQRGQSGAILAKMNEADKHRGWDLWLENDKFAAHIISQWPEDAIKVTTKAGFNVNQWHHVFVTWDGSRTAAGIKFYVDGVLQPVDVHATTVKQPKIPSGSLKTEVPITLGRRSGGANLRAVGITDFRIYSRVLSSPEIEQLVKSGSVGTILEQASDKRTPEQTDELFSWWLATQDEQSKALVAEEAKIKTEEAAIKGRGTIAHVSNEKAGMPEAYILARGDYDKRKDKVLPATPKALPPFPADFPKNRLGFAKWLLLKEHPLTSRVTVNRFWQELFGNGLVRTSGDFGITGELPSHPELLDWLAEDFESHWDVKRFFKLLVTSSTYRQAAMVTADKLEKDPANKWLSRGPRFRMDAEMIRDYALASSGLLVKKIGGPSVKPYQPEGVWEAVAMIGSNTRNYVQDKGENLYRRSMYTFWKRSAPPASMEVLNAPNRETCVVKRERTNTPLQALVTLNDVQFVEAARVLAENTIKGGTTDDERLDVLAERLLARTFDAKERPIVKQSLAELRKDFTAKPAEATKLIAYGESKPDAKLDAIELAAWTMLANEVLNLDEVLCK